MNTPFPKITPELLNKYMMKNTEEETMVNFIKNNPNMSVKDMGNTLNISKKVLTRIRKKYGMYRDRFIRRLTSDEQIQILEYMRNHPYDIYDEIVAVFGCTMKQAQRIRRMDNKLPPLMKYTKRKKNGVFINPEKENEIIEYMKNNLECDHNDINKKFGCSIKQTERIRRENNFPQIKRRPAETTQYILKKEGKRYCPKCDTIKKLEFFGSRLSCCIECEKERTDKRNGEGNLEMFLKAKLQHSKRRSGIISDITYDDLMEKYKKQEGLCFYTNRKMLLSRNNHFSLSVDRLDSTLGYTNNNIVLCCSIVNYMKQEYDIDIFLELCSDIHNNTKIKNLL